MTSFSQHKNYTDNTQGLYSLVFNANKNHKIDFFNDPQDSHCCKLAVSSSLRADLCVRQAAYTPAKETAW